MWGFQRKVSKQPEVARRLCAAFPRALAADVTAVLTVLPASKHDPGHDIGPVRISGEDVHIPTRIYSDEPNPTAAQALQPVQQLLLSCLLSRHHDGFVRERHVGALVAAQNPWLPPFVLQLVGEYVVEIASSIAGGVPQLNKGVYARFAAQNEGFIHLTRQRVVSYWDCYYRRTNWPYLAEYPAFQVMHALGLWSTDCAHRALAR